jgi:hypothetical protein
MLIVGPLFGFTHMKIQTGRHPRIQGGGGEERHTNKGKSGDSFLDTLLLASLLTWTQYQIRARYDGTTASSSSSSLFLSR